ncbi:MAG TPA: DUF2513 domain-containing protein [Pyrinomonadaceae bacterium]|nr:DUF2513 domain-containing protein [Pyrinomonadaceae bacterium]
MVRDIELIRLIMLNVQAEDFYGGVEGYTDDAVNYHKALLIDKGLVEGSATYSTSKDASPDIPRLVLIKRITWEGHDFIDGIVTDTKWNKVKTFLAEAGKDVTIETIKWAVIRLFSVGG